MSGLRHLNWKTRAYRRGHAGLQRLHLRRWIDYRWSEVMCSAATPRPVSGWDEAALWLGEAGPGDLEWLSELAPPAAAAEFPQRWRQGRRCFAAALTQPAPRRCIGYLWVTAGPARLAGSWNWSWQIPAGAAWLYDALAHPLMPGTYPDLFRATANQLQQEGVHWLLGQVEMDNLVSRRVHRAFQGQPLGWVLSLRLPGFSLHWDQRGAARSWRWGAHPAPLEQFLAGAALRPAPSPADSGRPAPALNS